MWHIVTFYNHDNDQAVNNSCEFNFILFSMWVPYHIIYSISTKQWYVTRQIKKIWVSVWNEVWLVLSILIQILKKVEGFYKAKNFINDIKFGTSLFVFCDLNTYFQLQCALNFSRGQTFFKYQKMTKYLIKNIFSFTSKWHMFEILLMFYWWQCFQITQIDR